MSDEVQSVAAVENEPVAAVEAAGKKEAKASDEAKPQAVAQQAQSGGIIYKQEESEEPGPWGAAGQNIRRHGGIAVALCLRPVALMLERLVLLARRTAGARNATAHRCGANHANTRTSQPHSFSYKQRHEN